MPTNHKRTDPPYILYDIESSVFYDPDRLPCVTHVHKCMFPTIGHINNKDTKVFIKFDDVELARLSTDTGFGRTQHKSVFKLTPQQGELIKKIEDCLLSQIENTVMRRKLISPTVIKEKFKSNLTTDYTFKAKIAHDRTSLLLGKNEDGDALLHEWSSEDKEQIPQALQRLSGAKFEYVTFQPTVLYVLEDMTVGCSWDVKSMKHHALPVVTTESSVCDMDKVLISMMPTIML